MRDRIHYLNVSYTLHYWQLCRIYETFCILLKKSVRFINILLCYTIQTHFCFSWQASGQVLVPIHAICHQGRLLRFCFFIRTLLASGSRCGGSGGTPDLTIGRAGNWRVSRSHHPASATGGGCGIGEEGDM